MVLQNKIEQYIEIIRELDKTFCEAQSKEILPLSFFSSSIDILNRLKTGIYELEALQLQIMQEHVKKVEKEVEEIEEVKGIEELEEVKGMKEVEEVEEVKVLADAFDRKTIADVEKSLSLNDKFMFQRNSLQDNVGSK